MKGKKKKTRQVKKNQAKKKSENRPDSTGQGKSRKSGKNREFLIITYMFVGLFCLLIGYLAYFQVFKSETVISSSYNSRLDLYAEHVIRGDIVSSDGVVLATTDVSEDGTETRSYPYGRMFAHAVGYFNNGKSGVESSYNFNLLRSHSFFLKQIINDLKDEKNMGDSVVTTLDYDVQATAYNALGSNDGAVVVLEASTGKVLAMVSKPDYDPNTLASEWDTIVNDDSSSVLLNRATSGSYPPGSVFKIFTTLEYIHENADYDEYVFDCVGELSVDGNEIHCYHSIEHGTQDLLMSFANSCNTSYANIGLTLDISSFQSLAEDMLFNTTLPVSLSSTASSVALTAADGTGKIMPTAIGQGDTTVTPLHMAMIAAAIDQDGVAWTPYIVDHTENENGTTVKRYRASEYGSIISESDAAILQEYMSAVITYGTASALSGQSYTAAGKTGSAEYDSEGNSHGWFVGYASKEGHSDIAIAVIVEDGGSGSTSAVPAAKAVFDVYFNQ
ncbi:MAG: penicillin-binding protein 2 [Clostridiales bacterium]|nr:penicillin-binding protein 2 [Clostridiales bacterium]